MKKPVKHKERLNPKQEKFCRLYASDREFFGNGVESYLEAYNLPPSKYTTALSNAGRLLVNAYVLARIDELLDIQINNAVVDKELGFTIIQKRDLSSKVAAIREYNRVKKRVDESPRVLLIGSIIERLENERENPTPKKLATVASLLDSGQSGRPNQVFGK